MFQPNSFKSLNADGQFNDGLLGTNLFAYCNNNPVNMSDPSGHWPQWIKNAVSAVVNSIKKVAKAIANFAENVFGAGATVVNQVTPPPTQIVPDPSPITVKSGTKATTTQYKNGDSSKPVSVYAQGRSDNYLLSSAGLKIHIKSFTLNVSLGLDNIGISGSIKNSGKTNTFGLSADVSQLKVGLESSATTVTKWDVNMTETAYTNGSVSGWAIATAYILVTSGQWVPSPQAG